MRILKWLDEYFEQCFLVILSTVMVVVIALQVFMRFALGSSLGWSDELARYCFIWLVYLGISFGVKKQRHIKVDAVLMLVKDRGKIIFNIIANLIFLGFAVFVVIYGAGLVQRTFEFGQTSPAMGVPMGWAYISLPIGMGITAIRVLQNLIILFKTLIVKEEFDVSTESERLSNQDEETNNQSKKVANQ